MAVLWCSGIEDWVSLFHHTSKYLIRRRRLRADTLIQNKEEEEDYVQLPLYRTIYAGWCDCVSWCKLTVKKITCSYPYTEQFTLGGVTVSVGVLLRTPQMTTCERDESV